MRAILKLEVMVSSLGIELLGEDRSPRAAIVSFMIRYNPGYTLGLVGLEGYLVLGGLYLHYNYVVALLLGRNETKETKGSYM